MNRWMIGLGSIWVCALLVMGCETDYPPIEVDAPVPLPLCTVIPSFGSGESCVDDIGMVDIGLCGSFSDSACSPGRLCFADPLFLSCVCSEADDCVGFTDYINTARATFGQDPLDPSCEHGMCVGDVDLPEEE